ncbi:MULTISPECIES: hypothetical protein [unclassified Neisseria]|uniref:hypothetical protein n=1 Tax=unclassified Neisseria TaxID=2623750 RepID=UPI0026650187|nr:MULTISPECIES: hypothetical protein [unclassified Neisseria]MDO1510999.1 hypothetical protein [Neisseria sp. MVDL19-042950]MDO1517258.1 hypothetical protein [Neisseria sp. MVDL18-041461]MDO1564621.1 hypothetical protein [Neisseria sp. MVDL20-010259]
MSAKKGFNLKPKHLLMAVFVLTAVAVGSLIVGILQTMKKPAAVSVSTPAPQADNTVEVWSPRGASATVAAAPQQVAVTQASASEEAAASEVQTASQNKDETGETNPATAAASAADVTATNAETPVLPKPSEEQRSHNAQPKSKSKPKEVIDNLF